MDNKKVEFYGNIAHLSLVILVISMTVSIFTRDLRPFGCGIALFGIFYFGFTTFVAFKKLSWLLGVLFGMLGIFIFVGGIALFLHHYDIDFLFNLYFQLAYLIDKKL